MPRDERLTSGQTDVRGHEPECRTARYVTDLGYELEDAERYCICPELHAYGDRLTKETLGAPQTLDGSQEADGRGDVPPHRGGV